MKPTDPNAGLKALYLPPTEDFTFIDVPVMQFMMIDGEGSADEERYSRAVKWLFAAIYPIKRIARERMGRNFIEPPLEGLWWADEIQDFICGKRDKLRFGLVTSPSRL